jgi:outer membrane lipoprotein-sorting protein
MFDKEKKPTEKPQNWKVQVKGQKFKLEIPGSVIVCDGKTLWNYNKDAKEVTIKNFDPNNEDMNPSSIFTMYETGYKFKYDKEQTIAGAVCNTIDLYPAVKPEKKKFHTIKLSINKAKKQIVQMKMMMKDGGTQVYACPRSLFIPRTSARPRWRSRSERRRSAPISRRWAC